MLKRKVSLIQSLEFSFSFLYFFALFFYYFLFLFSFFRFFVFFPRQFKLSSTLHKKKMTIDNKIPLFRLHYFTSLFHFTLSLYFFLFQKPKLNTKLHAPFMYYITLNRINNFKETKILWKKYNFYEFFIVLKIFINFIEYLFRV